MARSAQTVVARRSAGGGGRRPAGGGRPRAGGGRVVKGSRRLSPPPALVRGGLGRCLCSLLARPFVCGCHIISTMLRFHTPLIEPDRQISRIRLSDKAYSIEIFPPRHGRRLVLVVVVIASGTSQPLMEFIGSGQSPGFRSLPSMGLERRPLPSTGVTRRPRYYEPHRRPRWPGLSLTGVRLGVTRPRRLGFPVLRWISVYRHAVVITPVARWYGLLVRRRDPAVYIARQRIRNPMLVQGRRTHRTFRGLLYVHSRYGLPARCIAKATHVSRRLRRLRYLRRRSDSYWLERPSCQVGVTPTEDQHLCTAAH